MIRKFQFDYDYEQDNLFLYDSSSKSKANVEFDDFIIDFNHKKEIVGIEVLNASFFFENVGGEELKVTKNLLKTIKECVIDITTKNNFSLIKLKLLFHKNKQLVTTTLVPTIRESSPALANV